MDHLRRYTNMKIFLCVLLRKAGHLQGRNPELKADYTCSDPQTQVDGYQLCFIVLRWVLSNICLFISDNMTFVFYRSLCILY